jgi:hypothetical protein
VGGVHVAAAVAWKAATSWLLSQLLLAQAACLCAVYGVGDTQVQDNTGILQKCAVHQFQQTGILSPAAHLPIQLALKLQGPLS